MVSFAFTAVHMDTAQAHVALQSVESDRQHVLAAVNAFITAWEGRRGFTIRTAERMREQINGMLAEINKNADTTMAKVETTKKRAEVSSRYMLMHVIHAGSQAWNILERAFGLSKNASVQIASFAISAVGMAISAGYAAAAQYATMGPWGIPFATLALLSTGITVAEQATMIAQRANLESQTGNIGDILGGMSI